MAQVDVHDSGPEGQGRASLYVAWARRTSGDVGVPARALAAYATAQEWVGQHETGCGLTWTTLAGIGYVESQNGDDGGGLRPSGRPLEDILGIALDGTADTARIADTDRGQLDGDALADRAVGPLQFLPSTWSQWATDGDVDGRKDPQDIDDAALAAARYLCASGSLDTDEGWSAAIWSYNHSADYVNQVYAAANQYATASTR